MRTMIAARMHEIGGPMTLDTIPVPEVRPTDVLVAVKACGMVPNLGNVLQHWQEWFPHLAAAGLLDLSVFEHHCYPLAEVNEAISGLPNRNGGFSNFVINP